MIYQKIITFFNLIFLNFLILFLKLIKRKKIILFYHPKKNLTKIHTNYIEKLFKNLNKNIYTFYGHEVLSLRKKSYFFLQQGAIKYIYNIDIFISNNMCDIFPKKSTNIFIHHDIYDSVLVNNTKEVGLFKRFIKYDYLFLSNKKTIEFFHKFFNKNIKILKNENLPKIFETGYFKLDCLRKVIKDKRKIENNIVIAISEIRHVSKLSLVKHLKKLIYFFINDSDYKIFFRPYPHNRNSVAILKVINEFSNNDRFVLDVSENYSKLYSNTKFLITDISGTAYTYAFFTKKPVIFFSPNEKLLKKYKFDLLNYFIDRKKIGLVVTNYNELSKAVKKIKTNENLLFNSNKKLLSEMTYIDKSKERINFLINRIIDNNYNIK